jgi:hypothetical protein
MKTVTLEIDERSYPSLIDFLSGLPKNRYAIFEDDPPLSDLERQEISKIRNRLAAGDESEFEDWADVRKDL